MLERLRASAWNSIQHSIYNSLLAAVSVLQLLFARCAVLLGRLLNRRPPCLLASCCLARFACTAHAASFSWYFLGHALSSAVSHCLQTVPFLTNAVITLHLILPGYSTIIALLSTASINGPIAPAVHLVHQAQPDVPILTAPPPHTPHLHSLPLTHRYNAPHLLTQTLTLHTTAPTAEAGNRVLLVICIQQKRIAGNLYSN